MIRKICLRSRRGAMLVLIAFCLPLCIIMAAFAVDVAWIQLVRTELRTATDAASRAAAKELSLSQNTAAARQRAKETAQRNQVAGEPMRLANKDIEIGKGVQSNDQSRFQFTKGGSRPNAVRVTGDRTQGSLAGPVNLFFGGVLGVDTFEPVETATSTQLDRDICLVVDRSGSMMWTLAAGSQFPAGTQPCGPPHPTKSRWGTLATAVEAFLVELDDTVQDERVSLVSYSSNTTECGNTYTIAETNSVLVKSYDRIRRQMEKISSKPVKGSTAISAGIDVGVQTLIGNKSRPFAVRTMIVMTDGIHNLGREPILSAQDAVAEDIVIHTITFSADADITRMQAVAAATGGRHFHADDLKELVDAFKEIASTLPVLLTE